MNDNLKRAIALHRNGQIDKAEILYLDLLKKDENNSSILQLLGTVYLQKKNYELSEKYFLKSFNLDPNNPATINNLGILNKQNKKLDKAINYFDINIKKNNFLNSWVNKSNILIENERFEEGLQFSKNALKKYPQDVKLRNNFAIFLFKCGFQNEALKIYQQFDEENLHFEDSFYNYSNILIQINDLSKALLITNKLILNNKKNLNGLHQRHLIYKLLFDFTNAEIDILNSIKIDKFNFISNKMLVELYIDYKKFDKALYYCELMINHKIEEEFFGIKKILCKINLGIWQNLKQELEVFNKNFKYDSNSINPLSLKYINDDPLIQTLIWQSSLQNINDEVIEIIYQNVNSYTDSFLNNSLQNLDMNFYMYTNIIPKIDIAGMANGLEIRPPYLDDRIIEFGKNIKTHTSLFKTKLFLREYIKNTDISFLNSKKKHGFAFPLSVWFKLQGYDYLNNKLKSNNKFLDFLKTKEDLSFLNSQLKLNNNELRLAWSIYVILNWLDKNEIN